MSLPTLTSPNILVLGSGAVAPPCVEFLLRSEKNTLTIACRTLSAAQSLAANHPRAKALALDVANFEALASQVEAHDVVISLVPFVHHPAVIKAAIRGKTHVVTTSYVSPAMRALEDEVKQAGIVVLNEVGVDPGVDHLYAVKTIDEVHASGGKILEFYSYCGGLPTPAGADNPLRFKFSWSPRGALLSQFNSAKFYQDGELVEISNQDLMARAQPYFVKDGYSFVAYPNRDSTPFREAYRIPEAKTVVRGSLRYDGNPSFVHALIQSGWISSEPQDWLKPGAPSLSWAELQQRVLAASGTDRASLVTALDKLVKFPSASERERIIAGFESLGLFSATTPAPLRGTLVDILAAELEKTLSFGQDESDLVMLQHKFVIETAKGAKETWTSTLELLGEQPTAGPSAMAKSVGVTCGVATQLFLEGLQALQQPGIYAPYSKELCDPIRLGVEREGIIMVEEKL